MRSFYIILADLSMQHLKQEHSAFNHSLNKPRMIISVLNRRNTTQKKVKNFPHFLYIKEAKQTSAILF